jgi:hypothetical protein
MNRSLVALLLTVGCSNQTAPAAPSIKFDVGGYNEGYPIAVGTAVTIGTDWSGECTEGGAGLPMPGLNKAEPRTTRCDHKEYSIRIACERWGKRPGPACSIRTGTLPVEHDLVVQEGLTDTRSYQVEPLGDRPVRITATITHGDRTTVHHSEWLYPIVLKDLVAECRLGSERTEQARPCDGEVFPKGHDIWMTARSASNAWPSYLRVNALRVNSMDQRDGIEFPLARVLPREAAENQGVAAGDYKIVLEANPAPDTVRHELTVRVR